MKLWNGLKYVAYTIALLGIVLVLEKILSYSRTKAVESYDLTELIILTFALSLVMGVLLSLESFIKEFIKKGKWMINKEKLVFVAGISFLVAVVVLVVYKFFIGLNSSDGEDFLLKYTAFPMVFYQFLGILVGYTIPACFKKELPEEENKFDCNL